MRQQRAGSVRGKLVIGLVAVAAVAGLIYAAHAMDLVGLILRMHTPPQGVH